MKRVLAGNELYQYSNGPQKGKKTRFDKRQKQNKQSHFKLLYRLLK